MWRRPRVSYSDGVVVYYDVSYGTDNAEMRRPPRVSMMCGADGVVYYHIRYGTDNADDGVVVYHVAVQDGTDNDPPHQV